MWRCLTCISIAAAVPVIGCGAGDTRLDPGDLELRDLLGVSSDVASTWDADQRAAARRVLSEGLATDGPPIDIALGDGKTLDERIGRALTASDQQRRAAGDDALGVVRVTLTGERVHEVGRRADATLATLDGGAAPHVDLVLSDRWHGDLPGRGLDQLAAIAIDAGHHDGSLEVAPAARVPVIATYVESSPPRLLVNPVFLAVLEPGEYTVTDQPSTATEAGAQAIERARPSAPAAPTGGATRTPYAGNPYSFYGSVNECAAFQRTRCESCLSNNSCEAVTANTDGATECQTLANNDGRGYYLLCINLSLAITSIANCSAEKASGCARDVDAANDLGQLENNKNFLEDPLCASTLDGCLADIFGAPPDDFPGLVDGGVPTVPTPPRSTNVSCSESCDNNNCEASPSCGSGPSCGNSLSCDGACSSSNDQSGCGGDCNACTSDSSGNGGSSSCGGSDGGGSDNCGGSSSDGDGCGDGGSSCGGGDSSSSCGGDSSSGGGGGCGGDSSSGGGGGCGGGSSSGGGGGCGGGGSSSSSSCSGGGGGGGSSGSSCSVARRGPSAGATLVVSVMWGLLPIPAAALMRRKSKKKPARNRTDDGTEVTR